MRTFLLFRLLALLKTLILCRVPGSLEAQHTMQQQLPSRLTDADEDMLVGVLQQVLNPSQSSLLLSGNYISELQKVNSFLGVMMVGGESSRLIRRKSCTTANTS